MERIRGKYQKSEIPPRIAYAEVQYKISMDERLISPQSISDTELFEHHNQSLQNSLKLVTGVQPLTDSERRSIITHLENLFTHYEEINLKKKNIPTPAIGIDLGTTFCYVAVFQNGKVKVIKNDLGQTKTPSYIGFQDPDDEDPIVGDTAKRLAHEFPSTTIFNSKRMIGRQFEDPRIQTQINLWPFQLKENDENGEILIKTASSGIQNVWMSPEEMAVYLLKYLKKIAEDNLGAKVFNAVVAVPAYFNSHQRELTKKACNLAGLNILQLVNEPTAGAVAYNIHKREYDSSEFNSRSKPKTSRNCLIFDLGGGTFDVAVLTMKNNQIHIQTVGGDSHLGGEDFDNNMVNYCLKKFKEKYGVDLTAKKNSTNNAERLKTSTILRRLKKECEEQKCFLTHAKNVTIQVDMIYEGKDLSVPMSRETFEELNLPLFQKCMDIVEKLIDVSTLQKDDIDDIVLVGGSSRIRKVQQMLSQLFRGKELFREIEPDEAVAIGAAMLAHEAENLEVTNFLIQEPKFEIKPIPKPRVVAGRVTRSNTTVAANSTAQIESRIGSGSGMASGSLILSRAGSVSQLHHDQTTPTVAKSATPNKLDLSFWIQKINNEPQNQRQQPTAFVPPSSLTLPPVELSDYLMRRVLQQEGKTVFGKDAGWKHFFVALRGQQLHLWRAENGSHSSEEQASVYDIQGAKCNQADYLDSNRSFMLELVNSSKYQFVAKDETSIGDWVFKIREHSTLVQLRNIKSSPRVKSAYYENDVNNSSRYRLNSQ